VLSLNHVVLDVAPNPVLRPKQRAEIHVLVLMQNIGGVSQAVIH
jgi:hypothetical protein